MTEVNVLKHWRFDVRRDGRFYVIGDLPNGRRWETTQVLELMTYDNCYVVNTQNSTYIMYF